MTTRKMPGPGGATLTNNCAGYSCTLSTWQHPQYRHHPRTGNGSAQPISYYGMLRPGRPPPRARYRHDLALSRSLRTIPTLESIHGHGDGCRACTRLGHQLELRRLYGELVYVASTVTANCTDATPNNIGLSRTSHRRNRDDKEDDRPRRAPFDLWLFRMVPPHPQLGQYRRHRHEGRDGQRQCAGAHRLWRCRRGR